ncbi:hypothetical protein [Streptomyces sp. MK37H]|uniref:hypothetical protein n=1 Tax=Streptomyces sp. MK37H TaxID=2699117 RepID=UPI001B36147D|nr:hypothetical protein [Streptomyces sp. MK37H]MBP8533255.1 hypothetical protein [Streptomyces sp. MK37H]
MAVVAAVKALPEVLACRNSLVAPLIPGQMIGLARVNGLRKRRVCRHPAHEDGVANRHACTFCLLEQFDRHLKRRDIDHGLSSQ